MRPGREWPFGKLGTAAYWGAAVVCAGAVSGVVACAQGGWPL